LFAPAVPLLVAAGLIEGYVSPHAPTAVRLVFAGTSAVIMIFWFGYVGREPRAANEQVVEARADALSSTVPGSR
jgi:hypothetical protein